MILVMGKLLEKIRLIIMVQAMIKIEALILIHLTMRTLIFRRL